MSLISSGFQPPPHFQPAPPGVKGAGGGLLTLGPAAVLSVLVKPDPAAVSHGRPLTVTYHHSGAGRRMENQRLPALPGDLGFSSIVCFAPG